MNKVTGNLDIDVGKITIRSIRKKGKIKRASVEIIGITGRIHTMYEGDSMSITSNVMINSGDIF